MVYFLGSDSDLPALTATGVREQIPPGFYVSQTDQSETPIPKQLAYPHIYYLGSHQGCGCGFRKSDNGVADEFDESGEAQSDHEALATYLKSPPIQSRPRQIYGCWNGDEGEPAEHFRVCTASELADLKFAFRERELITLKI